MSKYLEHSANSSTCIVLQETITDESKSPFNNLLLHRCFLQITRHFFKKGVFCTTLFSL